MARYFTINVDLSEQLGLVRAEQDVYFALTTLCKMSETGKWKRNYRELERWARTGSDNTATKAYKSLLAKGLIIETPAGVTVPKQGIQTPQNGVSTPQNGVQSPQNGEKSPQNGALNIINNKNKSKHASLFDDFWDSFKDENWKRSKRRTEAYFWSKDFPQSWRELAVARAKDHEPGRDPYWYLKDEDFLKVGNGMQQEEERPYYLTQKEIGESWSKGINLILVRDNETQLYHRITEETYKKFKDGKWFTSAG